MPLPITQPHAGEDEARCSISQARAPNAKRVLGCPLSRRKLQSMALLFPWFLCGLVQVIAKRI